MSTFLTRIAVDIEAVKRLLPAGCDLEGIEWNGNEVELTWSHQHLQTPFTFPLEVTVERLRAREFPGAVTDRRGARGAGPVLTGEAKAVDPKTKRVRRGGAL